MSGADLSLRQITGESPLRTFRRVRGLRWLLYVTCLALYAGIVYAQTDLTGTWIANDNGIYYFRQIGTDVWWAGFSTESPSGTTDLHRGLLFTSVFHGTLTGNTLAGSFVDVPKGQMLTSGPLTLTVNGNELESEAVPSAYRATSWERLALNLPQLDVVTILDTVKKNQNAHDDHTLGDNLYAVKSKPVSVLGYITDTPIPGHWVYYVCGVGFSGLTFCQTYVPPTTDPYPIRVGYPTADEDPTVSKRSYQDFICLNGNDSPPDGDLDFNIHVDRGDLDRQIGFWSSGWEPFPGFPLPNNPSTSAAFQAKLNADNTVGTNTLHVESILYGGTTECGDTGATSFLAPAWQQPGALSTLFNGVPIAGQVDFHGPPDPESTLTSNQVSSILGVPFARDAFVRITGILVFDCGHGFGHPCNASDPNYQNQEIHPIYSIDLIQDFTKWRLFANLTGVWAADDAGTYYVRQDGDTVWWLGLSTDEGQTFANIFQGTLQSNNQISGNWADVPLGQTSGAGAITLSSNGKLSTMMNRFSATGGFGGGNWMKLRDAGIRTITVVLDQVEFAAPFWPNTNEYLEIQVGPTRFKVKPQKPRRVKLADGREVMQAAIPARIRVDAPELGGLRMSAQFVGYRTNWTLSEADFKSGAHVQSMTPPRVVRSNTSEKEREEEQGVEKKEARAEIKKPIGPYNRDPTSGGVPALTLRYHMEPADPAGHDRLAKSSSDK
jgi:hypothetical protein